MTGLPLDFIAGSLFTLALVAAAVGGRFIQRRNSADAATDSPAGHKPAAPSPETEAQRRQQEEQEAAFREIMNYSAEQAYGLGLTGTQTGR